MYSISLRGRRCEGPVNFERPNLQIGLQGQPTGGGPRPTCNYFWCKPQVTTKHPSDPTDLRHLAPMEPENLQVPTPVPALSLRDASGVMGAAG